MQEKEPDISSNLDGSNAIELRKLGCALPPAMEEETSQLDDILDDFNPVSFFCLHRDKNPRLWFIKICSSPYFERVSILVILVNCVTLGLFDPSDMDCKTEKCQTLESVELAIYVFFLLEMLAKWAAMGLLGDKGYFADTWNRLDCFIVGAGTFEIFYKEGQYLSAVRSVRVLRPLRAINRVPSIRILVTLLLDTLPMLGNVLALCFLIFAIFGIVGVQMWQGLLRSRCVLDLPGNLTAAQLNISHHYIPSFESPDFVCSLPKQNGMRQCSGLPHYITSLGQQCNETLGTYINKTNRSNYTNICMDWNKYYTKCETLTENPSYGAISFDNILIAWVAIFQVITLEGWSDIMYYIQDAHGFWNWIYFVVLIVVASYFMTNLCLVVIATQFQETKQRESSIMKANRRRHANNSSNSTIASSRYDQQGCYIQILKYIEHLYWVLRRCVIEKFNLDSSTREHRKCASRKRKRKKKLVYHHHHHHHHHHHYHHVHCPLHSSNFPVPPNNSNANFGNRAVVRPQANVDSAIANILVPTSQERRSQTSQRPSNASQGIEFHIDPATDQQNEQQIESQCTDLNAPGNVSLPLQNAGTVNGNNNHTAEANRLHQVPTISVVTGSSCSLRRDSANPTNGDMLVKTTASVTVGNESAHTEIATHSFVSAASLSNAAAAASANAATTATLQTACVCAVEHLGKDFKIEDYEAEFVYEDSASDWSDDSEDNNRKCSCCHKFRKRCKSVVDSKYFMYVIMGSIFVNTLSMGIEYYGQPQKMTDILEIFNYIFTAIFAIEMLLKLLGHGLYGYIKDPYNLFDGSIVIISLVEMLSEGDSGISVLRSFRLLRIFKLVRFLPALRRQLLVMIHTMDNVMTFLALLVIFIFTASILGMHLFGGKYSFKDENGEQVVSRANFDTLFWALVTVFQVLTQEDWNTVMYDGMRAKSKWASLYFILLMTIGNYILFNLLVAILVEGFANQPNQSESMMSIRPDDRSRKIKKEELTIKSCKEQKLAGNLPRNVNRNTRVCISPTPSVVYVDAADSSSDEESFLSKKDSKYRRRSSLPILPPKARCLKIVRNHSAPVSPIGGSPLLSPKLPPFTSAKKSIIVRPGIGATKVSDENAENVLTVAGSLVETQEQVEQTNSFFVKRKKWSLYLFSPSNLFREVNVKLYRSKWFDRVVLLFILLNCVAMAMDDPALNPGSTRKIAINIAMYIFLGVFTLEMMIKVVALGLVIGPDTYLRSPWNVMDGFLVLVSWVDVIVSLVSDTQSSILGVLRVFRALRTLRPLRVISRAPGLKLVVETLISSLKPIGNIVLIAATFFIIFGILGVQLFKGKFYHCVDMSTSDIVNKSDCERNAGRWVNKEYNFDNLAKALLTLFVFSTKDGWVTIMYDGIDAVKADFQPQRNYQKWNVLYFVAFLLLAGFVVLNMLVGVVVENFQKCRDVLEKCKQEEKVNEQLLLQQMQSDSGSTEGFTTSRRLVHNICTHAYFDLAIAIVIAINVLFMALEHYQQPKELGDFLKLANYVFTAIFILEALLKIAALGLKSYFSERWNQLDILIVLLSVAGIVLEELKTLHLPINPTIIRVMRVLRIARVLKLLKTAEGIRKLLDTVAQALPQVGNLGLLFLLMFFIFAALGMELFGRIDCEKTPCEGLDEHAHFKDFGFAMLTLFRISTGDNWNGIMKDTLNKDRCEKDGCGTLQHVAPIYFATFVLATQFVLLNVVVAVLMKHLEDSKIPSNLCNRGGREEVLMPVIQTEDWEESKESTGGNPKYSLSVPNSQTLERRKVSFDNGSDLGLESPRTTRAHSTGENYPRKETKQLGEAISAREFTPVECVEHRLQPKDDSQGSLRSLRAPIYQMSEDSDLMSSGTSDGDSGPDGGLSFPNTHNRKQSSLNPINVNTQVAPTQSTPLVVASLSGSKETVPTCGLPTSSQRQAPTLQGQHAADHKGHTAVSYV